MRVELVNCEAVLLAEIAEPSAKRADIASTYGLAIMSSERTSIDWAKVNAAIVERWSMSALIWIKEQAWKRLLAAQAGPPGTTN